MEDPVHVTLNISASAMSPCVDITGPNKSLEKPVRSMRGGASQADNLFGPELLLTQGDIAEGDVFNVTVWPGSPPDE